MRNTEIANTIRKRDKRKFHIRKRIEGTAARPRLTVFKSNKYLYLQAIDDATGKTLVAASSLEEALKSLKRNLEGAAKIGEEMGKRLKEKNIESVIFDRNGYLYHGIVKAMADGARKAGIQF
jgi:large subunit ribosomal protein L18